MKNLRSLILASAFLYVPASFSQSTKAVNKPGENELVSSISEILIHPEISEIDRLKEGNKRFLDGKLINTDYKKQIEETKNGQKPHAVILSCMDSRVPPEIIFDQGIGKLFVLRLAGNVDDGDVVGSMEYAVEHAGSTVIVVMGHSHCGAVTGAVKNLMLGNLTQLLDRIKPAITSDPNNPNTIDETAKNSVKITIADILNKSTVIQEMVQENKVSIVGAFYDIETGEVTFTN